MPGITQKEAAKRFSAFWKDKGYEKGQSQPFWLSLLREVFGIEEPEKFITFEDQVHLDNTSFIDGYIDSTHVMIEQKSLGKDLEKRIRQSDGSFLTPYEQAKRYSMELEWSRRPRWIVTCNFESFLIYDMERPGSDPQRILLSELPDEYWRLEFLVDDEKHRIQKEQDVSEDAGKIIKALYEALAPCYGDMTDSVNQKSLNKLIVRLVFCLYAEDAEMFAHGQFEDYLNHFDAEDLSDALYNLFVVLDTPEEERRRGLKSMLAAFPYTNGGLFHDKDDADDNVIPELTEEVKRILVEVAAPFNWSAISPTIFGGIFESTLNPVTRREGGMHYTSIENIHKVIDPLFLEDLKAELNEALDIKITGKRREALIAFQQKLARLKFLDPACGSGNFLTETYLSLRRLENNVIRALYGEGMLGLDNDLIQVSINQFYGIEINDFAVAVATTALWISEAQMLRETESIIAHALPALPLKTYTNIHEGNALRMDWNEVVPATELNFIMGNPPFVGYALQSKEQKDDILSIYVDEKGKPYKTAGKIDYVAGWYYKASQLMQNANIKAALVSTNSITQGEQVAAIWKPLVSLFGIHIDFAWRTFKWDSEANNKANVHCVIIGFSKQKESQPIIFNRDGSITKAKHINPYLVDADDFFIEARQKPLCSVSEMSSGGKPVEGGFFIFTEEEKDAFIAKEPNSEKYFKRLLGAKDFINGGKRYCLWLVNANPADLRKMPAVLERIEGVREYRLKSTKEATRKSADSPTLFQEVKYSETDYVAVPEVSSERRRYVPMDYISADTICTNAMRFVPDASRYEFGVMTSIVHNSWMRVVCGRMKSDYDYSNTIVYNNFPWPQASDEQKQKVEVTAQAILDARSMYPDNTLADLYDELTMPAELRKAHRANDAAVMEAYGFRKDMTEPEIVAELFKMYQKLTKNDK